MNRGSGIAAGFLLVLVLAGCPKSDMVSGWPSSRNFVLDSAGAAVSVTSYHDSVRWTRVHCALRYHYLKFSGAVESISFGVMGKNVEFEMAGHKPDPVNLVNRWDGGFWIQDSLVGRDSTSVDLAMRGFLFRDSSVAGPAGTFTAVREMKVRIDREGKIP